MTYIKIGDRLLEAEINGVLADRSWDNRDSKTIRCGSTEFSMEEINNLDIHGKHFIVFAVGRKYYELSVRGDCSAYKYVLLFREHKKSKQETERVR